METNPWRRFEDFLKTFNPSIGFNWYRNWPQIPEHMIMGQFSQTIKGDDCFQAFHRDTLHFLLPYWETYLDKLGNFNFPNIKLILVQIFYSKSSLMCHSIEAVNSLQYK